MLFVCDFTLAYSLQLSKLFYEERMALSYLVSSTMKRGKTAQRVRDRMTTSVITVGSEDSLQTAVDLLRKGNIRELPVLEDGRLVGILTDRDLREMTPSPAAFRDREEIRRYMQSLRVAKAMTVDPLVVTPETSLRQAAKLLQTYRIGSLPVVEDERLVGIISVSDLLKLFIEQNGG